MSLCADAYRTGPCAGAREIDAQRFLEHMRALMPSLRAYAAGLRAEDADDLLQETLLRAWRRRASFRSDTDAREWFFAVMHGVFLEGARSARRLLDADGRLAARMTVAQDQELSVHCRDTLRALERLPSQSRQALELMASGASYEEAAAICRCRLGTFKSRLNRARELLARLVDGQGGRGEGSVVW